MNIGSKSNNFLDIDFILNKVKIKEKMKVADFGCGSGGHFVFPVASMVGVDGVVYAVDILKTVLEVVKRRARQENYLNIKIIWSNLEVFGATKIKAGTVDIGILANTLYLSTKRIEIIREVVRMLKKGGKLVIIEWKTVSLPFGPTLEDRVDDEYIKNIAKKNGLNLDEEFYAGQYHYGLIFSKL